MLLRQRSTSLRAWRKGSLQRSFRDTSHISMASSTRSEPLGSQAALLERFTKTVPPMDGKNYKGQHGKLGVVGGCTAYTGAPYYAAESAHKVGADLTYVFCTPGAAPIIKGFSPDMIVVPSLVEEQGEPSAQRLKQSLQEAQRWLPRMTVLVLGPGLGEDPGPQACAAQIIRWAREAQLPMVIDGSAVTTVARDPSLVQGYRRCVLTPNMAELGRLAAPVKVHLPGTVGAHWQAHAQEVAAAWDGPILVSKGPKDIITNGSTSLVCEEPGSLKRCGGIGDVLAGTLGVFLGWQYGRHNKSEPSSQDIMVASHAACTLLRRAGHAAFSTHGRAMGAGDILPVLPKEFVSLFGP